MNSIEEKIIETARGGILYDASRVRHAQDALFDPQHWRERNALELVRGGRSSVAIIDAGEQRWVLRHYRRGGFIARLSEDRYLWSGASHTRSFAEWRLLAHLQRAGLPAPAPIAARYVRTALTYRADLITEYMTDVRTLAQKVAAAPVSETVWRAVGATIAAFHRAGVHHADLNAHNILLREEGGATRVFLLDFDRGRLRARGAWEQSVLQRLHRSLSKIKLGDPKVAFSHREWEWLMAGYAAGDRDQGMGDSKNGR